VGGQLVKRTCTISRCIHSSGGWRTHASHDGIFSTITGRVLVMLAIATH
jgi:hypothetical protein